MSAAAEDDNTPDVLPPSANALLATLWVLLFGGRWLIVPLVQASGMVSPETIAEWDEGLLTKFYLILLSVTCIVVALRAVRQGQHHKGVTAEVPVVVQDESALPNGSAPGEQGAG